MKEQAITSTSYASRFFKADQRGMFADSAHTCFSTLNYGIYSEPPREPFGSLQFVNDVFIAPGKSLSFNRRENMSELIIPLAGSVAYLHGSEHEEHVRSEQIKFLSGNGQSAYTLCNPHENVQVNYLHLGFLKASQGSAQAVHNLVLDKMNTLTPFYTGSHAAGALGYIGVYEARVKQKYVLKHAGSGVFIYLINGAFEAEDRLMEHRDGLSLWHTGEIEFESLSQNAIIMLLEIPLEHAAAL